jgi:CHAT domain-containing protein/tetratricopeptide (TPR) repeat protein
MGIEEFVQQVLDGKTPSFSGLSAENALPAADRLKAEADHYFHRIDSLKCLRCANGTIQLGSYFDDLHIIALGAMVLGDTQRALLHRTEEAWQTLDLAGKLYLEAKDQVGWARTRTGRLAICVEMNKVEEALQDAEVARDIFRVHNELEKLVRLETNAGVVLNFLGQFHAAIEKAQALLTFIEANGGFGKRPIIYYILGHAHQGLGNLRESLAYYEQSRELILADNGKRSTAEIDLNIINIAQAQGHHRQALQLLHESIDVLAQHLSLEDGKEMMHVIEGYLFLNRFTDARDLARKVIEKHPANHENFDLAPILLLLAKAEAALGDFSQVLPNLERAEQIFTGLKAAAWLGTVYLYRAQVALRQGILPTARQSARAAVEHFSENGQKISHLMALLLAARVELADGQAGMALEMAHDIQKLSREFQLPHLSYEVHLLQGKIVEQMGKPNPALRHYQVATGIMERIQRSLVLTSRPDFLADKEESVDSLVRLNLTLGRKEAAFAALECVKAQVWSGYLSQLGHLRWMHDDPKTQPLIEDLMRLREEHHWHYQAAHDQVFREQHHVVIPPAEAALEASARERKLRNLTERLYLQSSRGDLTATNTVPISDIQRCLSDDTALIAYYSDGSHLWAFLLDGRGLDVYPLPKPISSIKLLLDKWQTNISRVLRTAPGSTDEKALRSYALPVLERLYDALIRPFAARLNHLRRLVIVPYGDLHYLPFQLLHDGENYLIERLEVTLLPTASLMTREPPQQRRKALAIAYSWDGRLSHTRDEACCVVEHFGGELYCEEKAKQSRLSTTPCQVLHISAHGQYRMDQPDFSYIQLADGPLYTDDLFQHDLSYELVTLSACETGRNRAVAGDELIGLGRGFLFAGAGALIASLWRVDETLTLELMDELYRQLDLGASKAAALREAQLLLIRTYPELHPAFWGAFELIGNADPLTHTN